MAPRRSTITAKDIARADSIEGLIEDLVKRCTVGTAEDKENSVRVADRHGLGKDLVLLLLSCRLGGGGPFRLGGTLSVYALPSRSGFLGPRGGFLGVFLVPPHA